MKTMTLNDGSSYRQHAAHRPEQTDVTLRQERIFTVTDDSVLPKFSWRSCNGSTEGLHGNNRTRAGRMRTSLPSATNP